MKKPSPFAYNRKKWNDEDKGKWLKITSRYKAENEE
jgi:hypothetical protein